MADLICLLFSPIYHSIYRMNQFGKAENIRLISKVSSLYYNYDLTQQEIADRLRLSRPKVSRLLKQAREFNIVQVTVKAPEGAYLELESELEQKFNLKEVIVTEVDLADDSRADSILKRQLGLAAADRSEEHTSELQSRGHLVCRLLHVKKKI